jgi:oligoribonuclease
MSGSPVVDDRLVWIDLEMTGLDVRRHVIVEIAVLVTDATLTPLDAGIDLVVHQPPVAMDEMDDFVRSMHTRSGLLAEIAA